MNSFKHQIMLGIFLIIPICIANAATTVEVIIYKPGDKGPEGGKVFFTDSTGQHGLEAKTSDEPNTLSWTAAVTNASSYGAGWHLPTKVELKLLYEQRKQVGGFANDDYWSSTEQDVNSAWIQGFSRGDQDRYNKNSTLKVRAVREF